MDEKAPGSSWIELGSVLIQHGMSNVVTCLRSTSGLSKVNMVKMGQCGLLIYLYATQWRNA